MTAERTLETPAASADVDHRWGGFSRLQYATVMNVVCISLFIINGGLADGATRWVLLMSAGVSVTVLFIAAFRRRGLAYPGLRRPAATDRSAL